MSSLKTPAHTKVTADKQNSKLLEIINLGASIGGKKILQDISYSFAKDKVYAIMGPNGSGKSTFAHVLMGNPLYKLSTGSKIIFKGKEISQLGPDKRSKRGIFMSFQSPIALSGVSVYELLKTSLNEDKMDISTLKEKVNTIARKLDIEQELLERPLNEGASGGERKKLELFQSAVLDKELIILDEIDTGVDVDALKNISSFINTHKKAKTYILITHYNRILEYIKPDEVLIMQKGRIVMSDGPDLALQVEKKGYTKLLK